MPPNIVWISESAISTGDAVTAAATGCCVSALKEVVDPDDSPPNIDRIIESASCEGEAVVVAGASFAKGAAVGAGELRNKLTILRKAGFCGAALVAASGNAMEARRPA
jgi:hypothetical protein